MAKSPLRRYFKEIRQNLNCPETEKLKFLADFENSVNLYLEEHPQASQEDIIHNFGDPKEIAESFLEEEDFDGIREKIKMKQRILKIVALAAIILVAAIIILGAIFVIDTYSFNHGYYVETIVSGTPPPDSQILETY